MDYEKKYKEALERMKSWAKGEHPDCFSEAQKAAEFVFPELKESEEERIRKAIVERILDTPNLEWEVNYNFSKEKALAWLEKQGEKPQGKSALEAINEVKVDNQNCVKPVDFKAEHFYVSKVDGQIRDMTYNPADKVEPKFHEGDWVTIKQ